MNVPIDKVLEEYEALKVPKPQRFTTGPDEAREIAHLTDEFFERTTRALKLSQRALSAFFTTEYRTLCIEGAPHPQATNDFIISRWLNGVQPLVSVSSFRDDYNFQVVLFSKYSLTPIARETISRILERDER